jgi:hypothetical protein
MQTSQIFIEIIIILFILCGTCCLTADGWICVQKYYTIALNYHYDYNWTFSGKMICVSITGLLLWNYERHERSRLSE